MKKNTSAVPAKSRKRLACRGSSVLACATRAKAQAEETTTTHTAQEKWKCQTRPMNQSPVAATRGLSGCHASHSSSREVKTVGDWAMRARDSRRQPPWGKRWKYTCLRPARTGIFELGVQQKFAPPAAPRIAFEATCRNHRDVVG